MALRCLSTLSSLPRTMTFQESSPRSERLSAVVCPVRDRTVRVRYSDSSAMACESFETEPISPPVTPTKRNLLPSDLECADLLYELKQRSEAGRGSGKLTQARRLDPKSVRSCSHCGTGATSAWRFLDGLVVCNACKCYHRKHGAPRPIQLRRDVVMSRNRSRTNVTCFKEFVFRINAEQ